MTELTLKRFQILSLSGGGFRGLYTAKIIADIERKIDAPIASRFDLLAGTSIGGILALALALEIPAQNIVDLFVNHGEDIFRRRFSVLGLWRAPYSSEPLRQLLSRPELFGDRLLGACRHPIIVPSINYSSGKPVVFKTPHAPNLWREYSVVDVALATSAAPSYFPRHVFENNQYVDGGLYANSPGVLALHEARTFFNRPVEEIHLLSIGTMSSKFTVNPRKNREGGTWDWGGLNPANTPKRLFGLSISVQESLSDAMLKQQLTPMRYIHLDDDLTDQRAHAVALDRADAAAREVLLGAASERSKICLGDAHFGQFMSHAPGTPLFYCGENANTQQREPHAQA